MFEVDVYQLRSCCSLCSPLIITLNVLVASTLEICRANNYSQSGVVAVNQTMEYPMHVNADIYREMRSPLSVGKSMAAHHICHGALVQRISSSIMILIRVARSSDWYEQVMMSNIKASSSKLPAKEDCVGTIFNVSRDATVHQQKQTNFAPNVGSEHQPVLKLSHLLQCRDRHVKSVRNTCHS
jgi:hypothetical protein